MNQELKSKTSEKRGKSLSWSLRSGSLPRGDRPSIPTWGVSKGFKVVGRVLENFLLPKWVVHMVFIAASTDSPFYEQEIDRLYKF